MNDDWDDAWGKKSYTNPSWEYVSDDMKDDHNEINSYQEKIESLKNHIEILENTEDLDNNLKLLEKLINSITNNKIAWRA